MVTTFPQGHKGKGILEESGEGFKFSKICVILFKDGSCENFRMAKPKTSMFVQELSFTRATPTSPQTNTASGEDPRKLKTKSAKYS